MIFGWQSINGKRLASLFNDNKIRSHRVYILHLHYLTANSIWHSRSRVCCYNCESRLSWIVIISESVKRTLNRFEWLMSWLSRWQQIAEWLTTPMPFSLLPEIKQPSCRHHEYDQASTVSLWPESLRRIARGIALHNTMDSTEALAIIVMAKFLWIGHK